jgi:hypothetical protein
MIYPKHLLTALGFIAGFIALAVAWIGIVVAFIWIWLVLSLAHDIAKLWRDLVGRRLDLNLAWGYRPSAAVDPTARSPARAPKPANQSRRLSQLIGWPLRLPNEPQHLRGHPRRAFNRWKARPSAVRRRPVNEHKLQRDDSEPQATVPLFVIDAPLFQSDPNVLEARPANILEVLEDACSTARAAGRTDAEITRILTEDVQRAISSLRQPMKQKDDSQ